MANKKVVYKDEKGNFAPTKYKNEFNKENYTRISLEVPKELAENFRKAAKEDGTSMSAILKEAITKHLEDRGKP